MQPRFAPRRRPELGAAPKLRAVPHDEDVSWTVADRRGRVLAEKISLAQIRARLQHGLLAGAAFVAREDETTWRAVDEVVGGSGARRISFDERIDVRQWYVTRRGGAIIGPVDTERLKRGLLSGHVPLDSLVNEVGHGTWYPVADVDTFADTVVDASFDAQATSMIVPARWSFADE